MAALQMTEKNTLKMESQGLGNIWKNYGKERFYLNISKVIGLEVELYNTGNVSSARLNGEKISNSKATKIVNSSSSFIDLTNGEINLDRHLDTEIKELILEALKKIMTEIETETETQEEETPAAQGAPKAKRLKASTLKSYDAKALAKHLDKLPSSSYRIDFAYGCIYKEKSDHYLFYCSINHFDRDEITSAIHSVYAEIGI